MKENKRLDINYKAYTRLVIRQKLPFFVVGVSVFILTFTIIFSKFIIGRQTNSNKTTNNQKNKQKIKKYIVEEGEDLWQIAEKNYGSGYNAYDIAQANNLKEPYILIKGQQLVIPSVPKRFPTQGEITPTAASTGQVTLTNNTYVVQPGDYLFLIAQKIYGDGNMMRRIIEANKISEPYNVEVGQTLTIPR
ncbi:hypothetical protein A2334_02880 [Candidatus Roizmanbacteria bacterium RIFOXYB2_FULL_38_10]|uniref:LysM domain-containing protein n=1 Tax=Candidatus Roizmanbacteria bacterium RIFOXYD1_FULL_38_12 TaxID=1802093 RepID=A0A1F7L0H3_9BACT|nr:MAG: hypothetical protein A3K47_02120 [Candidatus Roizmanbacteria bacterium RIFOXYA2_FULL_38_14]OGK63573.1 MAG: hypothetical protein A3K27_02120 [Candidatus Roizmanbacteria bacterium RIFOXYA1_FULL_37_12]OGK65419.1 MAG: hypothetical protein A3K38_02120 [Candidatus Roizmanbacteria bacterium RIFOXYB1_FULL_40_23]OGK69104.1 MAG: hypothetical protein A2334_02880 [Candidatus Roizmanbacteria bacterium RIFOXYB2_FULL_38_10]OGK69824.1 MAG: hypothetical protein A3K21_02125 [Candidatus Roizmanbacteria ba